jgi:hypothetical protein
MSTDEKIIKNKVGLLKLSEMLGSVSEACKAEAAVAPDYPVIRGDNCYNIA